MSGSTDFPGASVFQTMNNGKQVWKASMSLGFQDGKRRFVNGIGSTPEEAYERLQKNIARRLKAPVARRKGSITLRAFHKKWLANVESNNTVPATVLKYDRDMKNHVLPYLGSRPIGQITDTDISNLFNKKLAGLGSSAKHHTFSELKRLFIYAVKTKTITSNPMEFIPTPEHKPQIRKKQDKYIDRYVNMSKGIRAWLEDPECPFHDDYPRYMLILLGLRRAEILGLTWDCITGLDRKDSAKLTIKQELKRHEVNEGVSGMYLAPRTKNEEPRTIPLPEDWRKALQMEKKKQRHGIKGTEWENLIFVQQNGKNKGRYHTYGVFNQWWKKLLTAYWHKDPKHTGDLPDDYYWRPHDNRHILASVMAANGVPLSTAQSILGHLDSATTVYYTHTTNKSKKDAMNKIGDAL